MAIGAPAIMTVHDNSSTTGLSRTAVLCDCTLPVQLPADKLARSQVATPSHAIDSQVYSELVKVGFRRSGAFTIALLRSLPRLRPCAHRRGIFVAKRSHAAPMRPRRARCTHARTQYHPEHYALYPALPGARHSGGAWITTAASSIATFFCKAMSLEPRGISAKKQEVSLVRIVDRLEDGLSSVYTFSIRKSRARALAPSTCLADRPVSQAQAAVSLPVTGLLKPQDGLQNQLPAMEGLIERSWRRLPRDASRPKRFDAASRVAAAFNGRAHS